LRIYSQTLLTTSVRGSCAEPTIAASAGEGVSGLEKALGVALAGAFFFAGALFPAVFFGAVVIPYSSDRVCANLAVVESN
jgi:hypothetical protein